MDDSRRAVLFDALQEEGVDDPALFTAVLKHWDYVGAVVGEMVKLAIRDSRCPVCGGWWRELKGHPNLTDFYGMFLIHYRTCPLGALVFDLNAEFREATVDLCWDEANILREELKVYEGEEEGPERPLGWAFGGPFDEPALRQSLDRVTRRPR